MSKKRFGDYTIEELYIYCSCTSCCSECELCGTLGDEAVLCPIGELMMSINYDKNISMDTEIELKS